MQRHKAVLSVYRRYVFNKKGCSSILGKINIHWTLRNCHIHIRINTNKF